MTYREFLNSLSNEEFAQVVADDSIFNIACVANLEGPEHVCKHEKVDCFKCILALLESKVEEDINKTCSLMRTNESIQKTLAWKNYKKMCSIADRRFYFLVSKLQKRYLLNEIEVRICVLTLLNCEYERMAELLYRSPLSIGTLKMRVAKKLGTTAKELRKYLIENECVN